MLNIVERHKYILEELNKSGFVKITEVAEALGISKVTIRKDIKLLEEQGKLYKVHGSARLIYPHVSDVDTSVKDAMNREAKAAIAREARKLIDSQDSVIIASGSTITAFVEELRLFDGDLLNIVTPFLKVGMILKSTPNVNVIQLGGKIHGKSLSVRSEETADSLEDCFCSKLFLGVDGIDPERGVTTSTIEEAKLSQKMMKASSKTIVLADSTKFEQFGFGRICSIEDIDIIITDSGISKHNKALVEDSGIRLIIAQ